MNLEELLEQLESDLPKIQVQCSPRKKIAYSNEICIGLGYQSEGGWIYHQAGTTYATTSELTANLPDEDFPEQRAIEQFQFHLDDLSLDTCFAFIIWYLRYHQVELPEKIEDWLEYIDQWEKGIVKSTGDPFSSLGCLHSALAQSYFLVEDAWEEVSEIDQEHFQRGFTRCIGMLAAILYEEDVELYDIPDLEYIPEYMDANYALQLEYKKYLQSINHSSLIQLEMPIKDSNRTILIDAYIGIENTYIGLLKSFLQHDETRTWLKSGFRLIALYRPQLKGTKNEMVISVDPGTNISLEKFWHRLQKLEEERTGEEVQWHNYNFQHNHLSSPTSGSSLSWDEVIGELWELYNPANSILVRPYLSTGELGEAMPIYQCPPLIQDDASNKQLMAVKWDSLQTQQVLLNSPSIQKYLAVCVSSKHSGELPPVYPLPDESSFDTLSLPFGIAIIHHEGIFLLDDKNNREIDLRHYKAQVIQLLTRSRMISTMHQEILSKITYVQQLIDDRKILPYKESVKLNSWIATKKLELRDVILRTMAKDIEHSLLQFRQSVEKRWGIQSQLQDLYDSLKELEAILANMSEYRTSQMINWITIYGFPLALFAGLFEVIFQDVGDAGAFGVNWIVLIYFLILSICSVLLISLLLRKSDQQKDEED